MRRSSYGQRSQDRLSKQRPSRWIRCLPQTSKQHVCILRVTGPYLMLGHVKPDVGFGLSSFAQWGPLAKTLTRMSALAVNAEHHTGLEINLKP
jgi:hypothetical protein